MALYPIRIVGDPVLRAKTVPVTDFDDRLAKLASDMIETMHAAPGVGLAANQIGVNKRLFVFDLQDEQGAHVAVNPHVEIVGTGRFVFHEGCLSVPGMAWEIERSDHVILHAQDLSGNPFEAEAHDWEAKVFQHECDHLGGVLLLSQLSDVERKDALRELRERTLAEEL